MPALSQLRFSFSLLACLRDAMPSAKLHSNIPVLTLANESLPVESRRRLAGRFFRRQ